MTVKRDLYVTELVREIYFQDMNYIQLIDHCLLAVSENLKAFRAKKELKGYELVRELKTSEAEPLIVWIPPPEEIHPFCLSSLPSARSIVDELVNKFSFFYDITHTSDPLSLEDILRARRGEEGADWSFRIAKEDTIIHERWLDDLELPIRQGEQFTHQKLPDAYDEEDWKRIEEVSSILTRSTSDLPAILELSPQMIHHLSILSHRPFWDI